MNANDITIGLTFLLASIITGASVITIMEDFKPDSTLGRFVKRFLFLIMLALTLIFLQCSLGATHLW